MSKCMGIEVSNFEDVKGAKIWDRFLVKRTKVGFSIGFVKNIYRSNNGNGPFLKHPKSKWDEKYSVDTKEELHRILGFVVRSCIDKLD